MSLGTSCIHLVAAHFLPFLRLFLSCFTQHSHLLSSESICVCKVCFKERSTGEKQGWWKWGVWESGMCLVGETRTVILSHGDLKGTGRPFFGGCSAEQSTRDGSSLDCSHHQFCSPRKELGAYPGEQKGKGLPSVATPVNPY